MKPSAKVVSPQFGSGVVQKVRDDGVAEIQLDFGATAFVPNADSQSQFQPVPELADMADADKLAAAHRHKNRGNGLFKLGDFRDAVSQYELARVYLRHLDDPGAHNKDVLAPLLSNLALCHLRLEQPGEAVLVCDAGLGIEPANAKLFYLRGQARRRLLDLEQAAADLVKAVKLAPNNKQIRSELDEVKKAIKNADDAERKMFAGRLQSASSGGGAAPKDNNAAGHPDGSPWWTDTRVLVGAAVLGLVAGYLAMR